MRRTTLVWVLSAFGTSLLLGASAAAGHGGKGHNDIRIHLKGFEEVPIVVTGASGKLELDVDEQAPSIAFELTYQGLEGSITQAHIHIAQKDVNGGITLWLCQTATNPAPAAVAATTPQCPGPNSGTVSGTLTPASVLGIPAQGIPAGSFADVFRAIRAGKAYANVHTSSSPGGEIRGQLD
jgi:hypothetical protein